MSEMTPEIEEIEEPLEFEDAEIHDEDGGDDA